VVVGEPQGSPAWYPANDIPSDKATYTVSMTVPAGLTAVGNGALAKQSSDGTSSTFEWRERYAMAPYLATITLGRFDVTQGRTPAGIPTYVAIDPKLANSATSSVSKLPAMVDFLTSLYGAYPFETVGAIVDDAPQLGYSLETQTKPVFAYNPDDVTVLHELSHMWFGDAVTLRNWPDIWLHEGFATWSEWIWTERQGRKSAAQELKQLAATPASNTAFWNPPPGNPGSAANLFDGTIYLRGGMTLEALRERIGDTAFFKLLREWYSAHRYGNVTTPQFVALAERISGQDLAAFFDAWLYQPGKPAGYADGATPAKLTVPRH
jgi:aminopeptidase N